jgi:hypothetical protein
MIKLILSLCLIIHSHTIQGMSTEEYQGPAVRPKSIKTQLTKLQKNLSTLQATLVDLSSQLNLLKKAITGDPVKLFLGEKLFEKTENKKFINFVNALTQNNWEANYSTTFEGDAIIKALTLHHKKFTSNKIFITNNSLSIYDNTLRFLGPILKAIFRSLDRRDRFTYNKTTGQLTGNLNKGRYSFDNLNKAIQESITQQTSYTATPDLHNPILQLVGQPVDDFDKPLVTFANNLQQHGWNIIFQKGTHPSQEHPQTEYYTDDKYYNNLILTHPTKNDIQIIINDPRPNKYLLAYYGIIIKGSIRTAFPAGYDDGTIFLYMEDNDNPLTDKDGNSYTFDAIKQILIQPTS